MVTQARKQDYSVWDHIEMSDNEDEKHPSIDLASLFCWWHQQPGRIHGAVPEGEGGAGQGLPRLQAQGGQVPTEPEGAGGG
uniref:Cdc37 N-terminal domain-containing protein n=1 Tax=Urocitellus parryii TaxID=9999 RepID=A0A8D2IHW9_UROPR